jgi:polysaccharide export outer membrane protein
MGEVKNPGVYPMLGARDLFDFISAAGGATATASKTVAITHRAAPDKQQLVEISNDPARAAKANVRIEPGDTILVGRAGVVYVVGDVGKPGGFLIETNDRLTVLQAIALAQGTNHTAALNASKLLRKTSSGRQEIPIALKKILQSKAADVSLEDGDILFVPPSAGKNVAYRGFEAVVQAATGAAIYR